MAQNRFTEHVAKITGLSATQHKVLKCFAQFTDNKTGEGFPGLKTLAAGAFVARSTVQLAIDDLCEAGHLEFVRRKPTERGHVNVYRVVVPITDTDTDSGSTDALLVPISVGTNEHSSNQYVDRTDTDTDRYRTDQVVGLLPVNRYETPTPKPELNGTDPAKPYVDRVVKRFSQYKRPGPDAEVIARDILTHDKFMGKVTSDGWATILPRFECTMGDHATRHLIDILGWVFEINAYEEGERVFRWAERTHTLKNFRDHLCKDNSRLWDAYVDWCCDHKRHGGNSVGYALGTIGDAEYVEYNRQIRERIEKYKAQKAAGRED